MSLLRWSGFEMGDSANYFTFPTNNDGVTTSNVRTGTYCWTLNNANAAYYDLAADEDDLIIIGNSSFVTGGVNSYNGHRFYGDGGTVLHVEVRHFINDGGTIALYRGTTLLDSVAGVGNAAGEYFQIKVFIDDTNGFIEVRRNATTDAIIRFDGDTKNGGVDALIDRVYYHRGDVGGTGNFLDDLYICNGVDATGTQGRPFNDYLGDVRIYPRFPTGNDQTQLDGSDGNSVDNYLLVDEANTPNTADYVGSDVDGEFDTYAFDDLPADTSIVYAVKFHMNAYKSDSGTKSGRRIIRRAGTNHGGPDLSLATSPANSIESVTQDPEAAGIWTPANFNSSTFGYEVRP